MALIKKSNGKAFSIEFKIGIGIAWIYFAATMEYYKPKNEINGI